MKIESILNQFNELETEAGNSRERPQQYSARREQGGPSLSLSTPSPDCAPSRSPSVQSDSRTRTPWDAGGYSLPRDVGPATSSRSPFSVVSWGEQQESARLPNASSFHSRHVSMETSANTRPHNAGAPYSLPVRRMPSTPDVQQDAWTPKSEGRPSQHTRRSSLWTDYNTSPASGSHKVSDSRGSFSSCCSSTFSAGHSRISSVSTINGSHPLGSGVADLEAKLERLPRLSAPPPTVGTAPSMNPDIRLPQTVTTASVGSFSSGSPSDSILEARMMRRKHNHMSEDQSYLKPRDHFLQSLDRVHKRTISAPNPAQASTQPFPRVPTSLPPLASRHFEVTALPPQQINRAHERVGSEQYPWVHPGESSPAPSMSTRSPFESQESGRILSDRSLQGNTPSYTNSNDRVITACRRFRKVEVNTLLEGGDICMAVENCTTGSVPRKVISHLFGRNKVCTRRIPERVWVCMCRKHYQRIRYRTGADFSVTQIGMVYEQIVRMIFWSRGLESPNRTNQEGITIRSWTFSIRRREVKRLADTSSRDLVPHWIMQSLGEGKTHDEILDIVERLHHEIQQGTLKDVPPVEFLPEVVDAFTHAPAQLPVQFSNEGEISFANHPSRAAGEATESPVSFVKESSPLEPVQEEGSMSEHSSEQSSSSPTPPAAYNAPRPVYRTQPYVEDVPNRNTTFAFGARSPLANSGMTSDTERRPSFAYHDSQSPIPPSMSYFSINRQMQAPVTDHQGSHDNFSYTREAYTGSHHYGTSEFVLTDRNLPTRATALPMAANVNRAMHAVDYAAHGSRDNHNFYAAGVNTQIAPVPFNHPSYGSAPIQGQAGDSSYRYTTEHQPQFSMNDADTSFTPSTPDGRSYVAAQHLQIHRPYWHTGETGPNTRIGRSMDQRQQHPLAYVDDSSLQSSHQFPKGFSGPSGVGLGTNEGAPTTGTTTPYRPRHHHSYATIGGPNDSYAHGDQQTYQYSRSTSGGSEDWHGA